MKETRELQTFADQLQNHILHQDKLIKKLEQDAARYRWLRKYTGQMFMATEQQVDDEIDRAMARVAK
jgi:hypothetical protein